MSVKKRRSPLITVLLWLCLIAYVLLLLKVILFKFDHDTIVNILNDTDELAYTRVNVYKIFEKKSLDTDLLMRISVILGTNFFQPYSDEFESSQSAEQG